MHSFEMMRMFTAITCLAARDEEVLRAVRKLPDVSERVAADCTEGVRLPEKLDPALGGDDHCSDGLLAPGLGVLRLPAPHSTWLTQVVRTRRDIQKTDRSHGLNCAFDQSEGAVAPRLQTRTFRQLCNQQLCCDFLHPGPLLYANGHVRRA